MGNKRKKWFKTSAFIVAVLFIVVTFVAVYINDYYHPLDTAMAALEDNEALEIYRLQDGAWVFAPQELTGQEKGLIFYLGGHSLGGSMAAGYIADHAQEYKGLILLASYSTADLKETGLQVLSAYGSEDGVLNPEKYAEYKDNLPTDFQEMIIEGGCHAYFGSYGEQEGDGTPTISNEEQLQITVEFILGSTLH